MKRFRLEQRQDLLEFYFQAKAIDRNLHENVVHNLVAETEQQCPVYASLLLKFVKLVSLFMRQDVSVPVQCVNIEAVIKSVKVAVV